VIQEEAYDMDEPDVWVANDDGTDIFRARDITSVSLDYDGNVTVRLVGREAPAVTLVGHRAHHGEQKSRDLHRQLIQLVAQLSDSSGAHLVRPAHNEARGWQWVSEPL
jgi:hypothetical protein